MDSVKAMEEVKELKELKARIQEVKRAEEAIQAADILLSRWKSEEDTVRSMGAIRVKAYEEYNEAAKVLGVSFYECIKNDIISISVKGDAK